MRSRNNFEIVNKDQVLIEFENICDQVGAVALLDVKPDSQLVYAVDRVLQHGLRDPVRGYWSLVRSLTHSTTLKSLEAFVKYISSSHQKGLAWTLYTLEEGSLEYYLSSLLQDSPTLQQHYLGLSLLRDEHLAQRVVTAITTLRAEAACIQASMESSLVSESPLTPSLTSPVDSGVALVDSDTSGSDVDKSEDYTRTQSSREGMVWKQILGSSVTTETSSSSDNTLADISGSDQQNANTIGHEANDGKAKTSIIQNNKYEGVIRRPRKKKKSESGKRVSFHQDSNEDSDSPIPLRHPNNLNQFYVEGRNSWAGEGDSFFIREKENFRQVKSEIYERKGLSSSISIFDSEMGIEADCESSTTTLDDAKNNIEIVGEKLMNVFKQSLGLMTKEKTEEHTINANWKTGPEVQKMQTKHPLISERGAPEGQEDPAAFTEYERRLSGQQRSDLTSDSEWSLDTPDRVGKRHYSIKYPASQRSWPMRLLHEAPSKTSLVKRFLRSIPIKKHHKEKKPVQVRKPCLYIQGAKPDQALSQQLLRELGQEMRQSQARGADPEDEAVTQAMRTAMHRTVLMNQYEKVYKVYRVASTEGVPLLAVLTDSALYVTGLDSDNNYTRRHHIRYHTLDTVVIGPEHQTVMLVTVDHNVTVTVISALGHAMVTDMVTHLALAVWRVTRTHLSVCLLALTSMHSLYRALLSQISVTKDEKLHYYRYIRVEDSNVAGACSQPLPSKCGYLMYRPHRHALWLPGYILLKGGMLYVFGDVSQSTPRHVLSLSRGYFGGCQRVVNSDRPHTFEVLPFSQPGLFGTFQFAAADDYETSDWLQAFIQASSTMCESRVYADPLLGCGLLLTSRHLLTLDFPDKVLSCARLEDISAVRTAHTCCLLETSCREVQENGGDWILYFLTEQATSEFLDTLYMLRPELKQQAVVEVWESEALLSHCVQTSQLVRCAWDPLLRPSCVKQYLR